ncbi:class I SAM-dependent methyltransferase [Chloroflexus sp.]|uniref:class I SAM-dependent methyltransferase n=1 Tax=Chloroflexus sp. TaxID=1904827 RepID=UPI00298F3C40|nr:class I SAM-dependent methyltransferase [Chloroflexus sp.]MDW8403894.1 class I SAM-dependent methyltransferase [Chloroflexus sp.]
MPRKLRILSTDVQHIYHEEYYLHRVDGFDQFSQFDGTPQTLFERAKRNLDLLDIQPGEYFLDIGCGRGEVAIAAGFVGAIAIGIDFSKDAIMLAQQKLKTVMHNSNRDYRVFFLCSVATNDIFHANTFDKVLMSEFIEHISPIERKIVLKNVRKWLKPNGKLLVYTCPNRWSRYLYPLIRRYVYWKTGNDIGARPADTLHPDFNKYHLNEHSFVSLYIALRSARFRQVRVWFDNPDACEQCNVIKRSIKRSLLYNMLLGSHLTAVGVK